MEGRGGCCIERYAGCGEYDMSKVDRIMLRFRPIAPKPATGGSSSGGSTVENNKVRVRSLRGKRKYVRDNSSRRCRRTRKRKSWPEDKKETMVTLPLLPETPDRKDSPARRSPNEPNKEENTLIGLSCFNNNNVNRDRTVVMPRPVRVVGSWVIVECVMDGWMDGGGLGCTDKERRMNLEMDTCPGFISDGLNSVTWTNVAYRKMVRQGDEVEGEMGVWLVIKEREVSVTLERITWPAFTCRVRLQYTCGTERCSVTLPCDVWRLDSGGFAWKLDVKTALSLGR